MRFLIDTNAISEPLRRFPNPGYVQWFSQQAGADLAISSLTFGELKRGVALMDPGRRRAELDAALTAGLRQFADRILTVDVAVATVWAEVTANLRRSRRTVDVVDELIAATALAHRLVLVTRNTRDFEATGCDLLCPWSPAAP